MRIGRADQDRLRLGAAGVQSIAIFLMSQVGVQSHLVKKRSHIWARDP